MGGRILVLVFSDPQRDARVSRQIRFLKDEYEIEVAAYADPAMDGVAFHQTRRPIYRGLRGKATKYLLPRFGLFETYYWSSERKDLLKRLSRRRFDLVIANDIDTLPLALRLDVRWVLFDAHEYYPRQFEDNWIWNLFHRNYYRYLCSRYIPQAHMMTTVCEGLAEAYREQYGVSSQVITNASDYVDISPQPVSGKCVRIVHHGAAMRSRKIENMVRTMELLDDRFRLDLMLLPAEARYYEELQKRIKRCRNVRLVPPTAMGNVVKKINQYDIGMYLLEASNFNVMNALPNKFFDFVQARLAIAVGPSKEMARLVDRYQLGFVSVDFQPSSLARLLTPISAERIMQCKAQAHRYARELSSEANRDKLRSIVASRAK